MPGEPVTLAGPEAHHLLHVMRAAVGDEVTLFDGRGGEYEAKVIALRRSELELEVGPRREVDRELARRIVVGVALPKGDRQKWLVEKLTELGAARLVPLVTHRGTVKLHDRGEEKLERAVIEASKQCGRNVLMEVSPPTSLEEFLATAEGLRLVAHPGGEPISATGELADTITIAIGPEGGFTDEEVAAADEHGWRRVSLGPAILRIETAALAMVARLGG
jgi:16S rRNA (uracil1498-N3)-methyltransferase